MADRDQFSAAIPLTFAALLVTLVSTLPVFWPILVLVVALGATVALKVVASDAFDHHARSVKVVGASPRSKRWIAFLAISLALISVWYKTVSVAYERQRIAEARAAVLLDRVPAYMADARRIKLDYEKTAPRTYDRADPEPAVEWERAVCDDLKKRLGRGMCDELFGRLKPLDLRPDDETRGGVCARIDERLEKIEGMADDLRILLK